MTRQPWLRRCTEHGIAVALAVAVTLMPHGAAVKAAHLGLLAPPAARTGAPVVSDTTSGRLERRPQPQEYADEMQAEMKAPLPSGVAKESLPVVIQVAARFLRRDLDYETVQALSTNGFAPCIAAWENEVAHWHVFGRSKGLDIIGGRLGLRFRRLPLPDARDFGSKTAHLQACSRVIRPALFGGEVVLTEGGYDYREWSIITDARRDGTILAAAVNGTYDNEIGDFMGYSCWAVSRCEPEQTPHQADLAMLARAVRRIRGEGSDVGGLIYGTQAMDLWSAQFHKEPFCYISGGNQVCAYQTASSVRDGARIVSAYLRGRLTTFSPQARDHVETVIAHYANIVGLLQPALTGVGGVSYQQFMDDAEKREAHAAVIGRCRAAMVAAADAMQEALRAEGVQVDPPESYLPSNRKALPAVVFSAWEVGNFEDAANTEGAMVCTLLRANAVNGFDRKAAMAKSDWWQEIAGDADAGEVRLTIAVEPTSGHPLRTFGMQLELTSPASVDAAFEFIKSSVDIGQGVMVKGRKAMILCGYEDAPTRARRRVFWVTSPPGGEGKGRGWWTLDEFERNWWAHGTSRVMARFPGSRRTPPPAGS